MKLKYTFWLLIMLLGVSLTSCEIVGGIFKAGMWTGFIIIVVVIALIIWILSKLRGGPRT